MFEIVYTSDWHDGPRHGIADFQGKPHVFQSEWRDDNDLNEDTFLLTPIEQEVFALALEDWAIWRRWETAVLQGTATGETHSALPEDRSRYEQLKKLLEGRLEVDPVRAVRKKAEFRVRSDPDWSGWGWCPLEVAWKDLP